jgi:hypothetical protein
MPLRPALALVSLLLAVGCAGPSGAAAPGGAGGPSFGYRAQGSAVAASPLKVERLAQGRVEYRVLAAQRSGATVVVERAVANQGDDPVRVDLGRVRLRSEAGEEAALSLACSGAECLDPSAARGQVAALDPGQSLRLRAEFGPIDPAAPGFDRPTFIDEGVFVGGRLAVVAVPLER